MWKKTAMLAAALCLGASAAAQRAQPQPQAITIQQLLNNGYDLKTVILTTAPCGNQPDNRARLCNREIYFLQSQRKDFLFRCEMGLWNGTSTTDCRRMG